MFAAAGDGSILQSLLEFGTNPNARDAGGVMPLMRAAAAGSLKKEFVTLNGASCTPTLIFFGGGRSTVARWSRSSR
jgi:ankyrin repeat protein